MRKKNTLIRNGLLCGGILLLAVSCSRQEEAVEPEGVVARVAGRVITLDDLQAEARRRPDLSKEQLLEQLLENEVLLLRAEQQQLADDPAVRRKIDRLLIAQLRGRELANRQKAFEVTEEEIEVAYQQQIDRFTRPAFDRMAVLFLNVDSRASDAKKAQIQQRMKAAKREAEANQDPSGFGSLAVTCSDDQISRYRGGDIGWIARGKSTSRLPEAVLVVGRSLETGVMSGVIEAEEGLYLVMKTDTRPGSITAYEEVRGSLRRRLLAEGRRALEQEYVADCLVAAAPEVDDVLLESFTLECATKPAKKTPALAGQLPVMVK